MSQKFIWKPSEDYIERSNVMRFMKEHRIRNYERLVKRSQDDIEWFWEAIIKHLNIEFFKPYKKLLDTSKGIARPQWFVGGKINLTHNCIDKHAHSPRRHKLALLWEGENGAVTRLTYWDLYTQINRFANALKQLGVGQGDTVGIFMPMLPETVIALLACAKLGAIFTPIFSGFGAQAVASRLNDCEATLLITADGFYRRGNLVEMKKVADEAAQLSPSVKHLIVCERMSNSVSWAEGRDLWWHELTATQPRECTTVRTDSEDPFMIAYTSGTTGKPKGSVHVHGGFLVKIAQEVAHQVDLHDEDILFWVTDMGWIMGPWEVVGGLALGGTIFMYEGAPDYPQPDRLWSMIERHAISILGISPTLIRALMKFGEEPVKKHDLSSLRILGSTGEPWNPDPWLWFFKHVGGGRCPIINLSGGTEVGACFL
ncbi:AMP-binding protein, partial [Candidatus Acetothermia bacterium]|nr:AMP-binding protein [Candidatus Acetothermia bacterium]